MTLTEAAYWTRRFGVLFLGGFVFIVVALLIIVPLLNPPETMRDILKPNYACTDTRDEFLEHQLVIPSLRLATASEELIEIDTPTGKLDELPLIANVYEYANPGPSLIAQDQAKAIADKLGFDPEQLNRRGTIEYYWNEDAYGRRLTVDAASLNFNYSVNYRNPSALPTEKKLPTETEAASIASAFLRSKGWMLEDYSKSPPVTTLIDILPDGTFAMAPSRAEAELIRVDFYRNKPFLSIREDITNANQIKRDLERSYAGYKTETTTIRTEEKRYDLFNFMAEVFHLNTQKANISVYVGSQYRRGQDYKINENIYGIDYVGWMLQEDACGTYPLLSATTVANMIENGEASLVYLNEKNGDTVVPYQPKRVSRMSVLQVRLAYLDTQEQQRFLQPVYIIIGEALLENGIAGTFYYYMPAIDYQNLQNKITPQGDQ
jgi:hypothetical protein